MIAVLPFHERARQKPRNPPGFGSGVGSAGGCGASPSVITPSSPQRRETVPAPFWTVQGAAAIREAATRARSAGGLA